MENPEPPEKRRKLSAAHNLLGSKSGEEENEQGSQTLGEQTRISPRVLLNKLKVKPDVFERLRRISKVCEHQTVTDKRKREGGVELIEIHGSSRKQVKEISEEGTIDTTAAVLRRENAKDVVTEPSVGDEVNKERREQTCLDMQMLKQMLKEVTEKRAKILHTTMAEDSIKLHNRIRELERENKELQGIAKTLSSTVKHLVANKEKMKELTTSRGVQVNLDLNLRSDDSLIPVEGHPVSSSSTDLSRNVTFTTNVLTSRTIPSVRTNLSGLLVDTTASGSYSKPLSNQGVHSVKSRPTEPLFPQTISSRGQDEKRMRTQVTQSRIAESEIQHRPTCHQQTLQPSITGTVGVNYQQLQKQPPRAPRFSSNVQKHIQPSVPQLIQVRQQNQQHQIQQQLPREHMHFVQQPKQDVPQSSALHAQQKKMQTPPSHLSVSLRQQEQQQPQQYQQLTGQRSQHKNVPQQQHKHHQGPQRQQSVSRSPQQHYHQQQCHLDQWQQRQHLQTQPVQLAQPSIRSHPSSTHLQKIHLPRAQAGQMEGANNLVQRQIHCTMSSNSLPSSRNLQTRLAFDGVRLPHTASETSAPSDLIINSFSSLVNPQQQKDTCIPNQSYISRKEQESFAKKQNLRGTELVRVNQTVVSQTHKPQPAPNMVVQNSQSIQMFQSRQAAEVKGASVASHQVCISPERPGETVHTLRSSRPTRTASPKQVRAEVASFHQTQLQVENTQTDFTLASRIARPSPEYLVRQQQLQEAQRQNQKRSNNLQQLQSYPLQHVPHTQDSASRASEPRDSVKERQPLQSPGVSSTDILKASQHMEGERTRTIPQSATIISALDRFESQSLATSQSSLNAAIDNRNNMNRIPKPSVSITVMQDGIVLSWNMELEDNSVQIDNYELFACQDTVESDKLPIMWKKIGIVKALPLPMACTLTQFSSGNKYHFAVRAVDELERAGPFSDSCTISLTP